MAKALAVSQVKLGKLEEAAATTEKLLKEYPMDEAGALAVVDVAAALRESGQIETAMGLYEYAIGVAKGTKAEAMARAGRAQIWVTQGKDEQVMAEVDAIVADANTLPEADKALFQIGEEYYLKAHTDPNKCHQLSKYADKALPQAKAIWKHIIDKMPDSPRAGVAWYFTGSCHRRNGEWENMVACFRKAATNKDIERQGAASAWLMVGEGLGQMKREKLLAPEAADPNIEEAYTIFIQKYPDQNIYYGAARLGALYEEQERYGDAAELYEAYLASSQPDYPQICDYKDNIRMRLGRAYGLMGEKEIAIAVYEEYLKTRSGRLDRSREAGYEIDKLRGRDFTKLRPTELLEMVKREQTAEQNKGGVQ